MQQILVYGDSLTWGIVPDTRRRLPFEARWPGVLEGELLAHGQRVRVIEDQLAVDLIMESRLGPGARGRAGRGDSRERAGGAAARRRAGRDACWGAYVMDRASGCIVPFTARATVLAAEAAISVSISSNLFRRTLSVITLAIPPSTKPP